MRLTHIGLTPLHVAASNERTKAMLELIRNDADKAIVAGRTGTVTPLQAAILGGHVSSVKAMLKAGCPVDVVDSKGKSVYILQLLKVVMLLIKEMLSTGSDINATDNDGLTPLYVVAGEGNTEAALELIRFGAKKRHSCWCVK